MYSTAIPVYLWILLATFICLLSDTEFHTHCDMSSLDILSKIPSHPKTIKSWSAVFNLKDVISGVATTTLGFPPNYNSFASISPNVLETDSLPGKTLIGPTTRSLFSFAVAPAGAAVRL